MRFVCWITKSTNARSEYVILNCFSTATVVTRTRLSVNVIRMLPVLFEFSEVTTTQIDNSGCKLDLEFSYVSLRNALSLSKQAGLCVRYYRICATSFTNIRLFAIEFFVSFGSAKRWRSKAVNNITI